MTNSFRVTDSCPEEHPVTFQEFLKGMADGISQLPDMNSVHHARISQLTHAQLSVKDLEETKPKKMNIQSMWAK